MSNGNHLRGPEKVQGYPSPIPTPSALRDTKKDLGLAEHRPDGEGHLTHGLAGHLDPASMDALSALRAGLESNALVASKEPAAGQGQCAHTVNTEGPNMPLTGDAFLAPVVSTGASGPSAEERQRVRTPGKPPYSTDPEQPRSDLLKRTRSDLATEVRRLRRECARTRRKLRETQARVNELEGARDA